MKNELNEIKEGKVQNQKNARFKKVEFFDLHTKLQLPTKWELSQLKQFEPYGQFEVREYPFSYGSQAKIVLLDVQDNPTNRLVVWKRIAADKGLTKEEAVELKNGIYAFNADLKRCGWNVPTIYQIHVIKADGGYQLFSYEQFIEGLEGEHMLKNGAWNFCKWSLLRQVTDQIAAYSDLIPGVRFAGYELYQLPHAIDLRPANVVLDEQGIMWNIDFFTPKVINHETGELHIFNTKLEKLTQDKLLARESTREGILLRFFKLTEMMCQSISLDKMREGFIDILDTSELPHAVKDFVSQQIQQNYPFLDKIYAN